MRIQTLWITYVESFDASCLRWRHANDAHSSDTEQIESGWTDDRTRSKFTGQEPVADDFNARQQNLRSTRAERHQCQVGHRVVPDLFKKYKWLEN